MSLLNVYPVFDIEPVRGKGCYIYDKCGEEYLDFYGGHAVISIGHSHPHYVTALKEQAEKLVFYSNSIVNNLQKRVAEKLFEIAGLEDDYEMFFINSGAEANENAIKLASFANPKKKIVVLENGFHGRTTGAISITSGMKHQTAFNTDFEKVFIPINDGHALEMAFSNKDVFAVMVEPIQGIGGVHICSDTFLNDIQDLCQKHEAVFIADEIQCGFGRSGKFFAHQYADVKPDIITIAKGMGNGFPVGGVLVKRGLVNVEYGMAGTTFGGNHLACSAVMAVLEVIENEKLVDNASTIGTYLMEKLSIYPGVKEVRGRGLMIGTEMEYPISDLRKAMVYQQKVFTGSSSNPRTLRLLPPLNITRSHCDEFFVALEKSIAQLTQ